MLRCHVCEKKFPNQELLDFHQVLRNHEFAPSRLRDLPGITPPTTPTSIFTSTPEAASQSSSCKSSFRKLTFSYPGRLPVASKANTSLSRVVQQRPSHNLPVAKIPRRPEKGTIQSPSPHLVNSHHSSSSSSSDSLSPSDSPLPFPSIMEGYYPDCFSSSSCSSSSDHSDHSSSDDLDDDMPTSEEILLLHIGHLNYQLKEQNKFILDLAFAPLSTLLTNASRTLGRRRGMLVMPKIACPSLLWDKQIADILQESSCRVIRRGQKVKTIFIDDITFLINKLGINLAEKRVGNSVHRFNFDSFIFVYKGKNIGIFFL